MKNSFSDRIRECWEYRKKMGILKIAGWCLAKLILPQLIIDKFNDYFVIQTLALGYRCLETSHS